MTVSIPLAKKLKECGVFGVCGDEYLNYALMNRREWEAKGEEAVASMVEESGNVDGTSTSTSTSTSTQSGMIESINQSIGPDE
jgi:hypothetical protein